MTATPAPISTRKYVRVFPIYSGFRKKDDHGLQITTYYLHVYEKIENKLKEDSSEYNEEIYDHFEVILPVDQIISSHHFLPEVYDLFFDDDESDDDESVEEDIDEEDIDVGTDVDANNSPEQAKPQ